MATELLKLGTQNVSEVAYRLGFSSPFHFSKAFRQQGMVEIRLHTPFQHIFELEKELVRLTGIQQALVVPSMANTVEGTQENVGRAAASYLLERLRDGDTIALGGGQSITSMVAALSTTTEYGVKVVPAVGGVQGRHYTDVNNLTAELGKKLGGEGLQLHAPAFVDSGEERDILIGTRHVQEILNLGRQAQIAVIGIGTLIESGYSSYLDFNQVTDFELDEIKNKYHGIGEILSQAIDENGQPCALPYARRVIGVTLEELRSIPLRVGVASGLHKALPITAALRGGFLKTIVTDEITAREVIRLLTV
ncbi:MAG: sugar-binding transcriptional regulator [Anaerolineaceae bacterium]|nr:sugar-binding transcriptional regulator [Anaerolineaceae bacterium]